MSGFILSVFSLVQINYWEVYSYVEITYLVYSVVSIVWCLIWDYFLLTSSSQLVESLYASHHWLFVVVELWRRATMVTTRPALNRRLMDVSDLFLLCQIPFLTGRWANPLLQIVIPSSFGHLVWRVFHALNNHLDAWWLNHKCTQPLDVCASVILFNGRMGICRTTPPPIFRK